MNKVIYVHGHINKELSEELKSRGVPLLHSCWLDGGYLITLATSEEVDDAYDYLCIIGDNEELLDISKEDEPCFVGIHDTPIIVDNKFEFIGGLWGYEKDGVTKYEE